MARRPIVTCSPVAAMTSSSRPDGLDEISLASASRRLVSPDMADTTTTSWWPCLWKCATRRATFLMRSVEPTEVPPYFWTINMGSHGAEREGRVGAAESERVGERAGDFHPARGVGHEIEV